MVLFVFIGPMQIWAEEAKVADKEGFRVYTISLRCGSRNLVGVYESPRRSDSGCHRDSRQKICGCRSDDRLRGQVGADRTTHAVRGLHENL